MDQKRRNFLQGSLLASGAVLAGAVEAAPEPPKPPKEPKPPKGPNAPRPKPTTSSWSVRALPACVRRSKPRNRARRPCSLKRWGVRTARLSIRRAGLPQWAVASRRTTPRLEGSVLPGHDEALGLPERSGARARLCGRSGRRHRLARGPRDAFFLWKTFPRPNSLAASSARAKASRGGSMLLRCLMAALEKAGVPIVYNTRPCTF